MQCQRCGKKLENSTRCNFCGFENSEGNVREMSRVEKNFYNGVTIDAGGEGENFNSQNKNYNFGGRNFSSRTTYINFGGGGGFFSRLFEKFLRGLMNNNFLAKIIAGLIFIAFAGILFFAAIPIMFFMLALGIGIFLYARFSNKF